MANACKQQNNVSEAGIGKLSLLPLFLDLKGKRVIVIGASQGAKWKAELLAAAGAQVEHCDTAPTPGSALLEYLGDAAFAIADIADDDEARNFALTAKSAGVAYNIVDKPELCQFQFGAIVNHSPVIVSISTDGAAPVLAQSIRKRIEEVLPENLGAWGALAKRLRDKIATGVPDHYQRREVWRRLSEMALNGLACPATDDKSFVSALVKPQCQGAEPVVLDIPPERDQMTLRNCRILMGADVVHDYSGRSFVKSFMRREGKYVGHGEVPEADKMGAIASRNRESALATVICIEQGRVTAVR